MRRAADELLDRIPAIAAGELQAALEARRGAPLRRARQAIRRSADFLTRLPNEAAAKVVDWGYDAALTLAGAAIYFYWGSPEFRGIVRALEGLGLGYQDLERPAALLAVSCPAGVWALHSALPPDWGGRMLAAQAIDVTWPSVLAARPPAPA